MLQFTTRVVAAVTALLLSVGSLGVVATAQLPVPLITATTPLA